VQLAQSAKVFNLVGTAAIKNQSELETVLPLNSWAPATMKNQSEQDALLPLKKIPPFLIVGFKQYHQSSTHKSRQCRSSVNNLLINLWQSQMVDENETSNLRQCQSFIQISVRVWPPKIMYRNEAQMVVELSGLSLIGHSVLTELNGFILQHELIELINSLVHVGHIKLFKLSRLIVHSSSEGAKISKLIVDYILTPSSEGARRAASKLIVESTIVFELAGVCLAHIVFRTKPHKLIGEHFIASNYAAPSILCSTPHWLIVENILPGARVIPNISCEEPHGWIVITNLPPNFEQELAFDNEASFDTSKVFSQKSKLIVDSFPSSEGARRAASKLIFDFVVHHELIELINGLVSHIELTELISRVLDNHVNYFQQGAASHFNDACIHRLIVVSVSEGARQVATAQQAASSTILKLIDALISEGA
jgi:hypothetical protein